MSENIFTTPNSEADYLSELIRDRERILAISSHFTHVLKLLDQEISRVRKNLFNVEVVLKEESNEQLPVAVGSKVVLKEKVFPPVKKYPGFNFVGRLLGPKGLTVKQLEEEMGCRIEVRGRGSMRDRAREERYRGLPKWQHLQEDLHILLTVEDTEERARLKLKRALKALNKILVPTESDELKKRQLLELAIINGTYRNRFPEALAMKPKDNQQWMCIPVPKVVTQVPNAPLLSQVSAPIPEHLPPLSTASMLLCGAPCNTTPLDNYMALMAQCTSCLKNKTPPPI